MNSNNYLLSQSSKNVHQIVGFCGEGKLRNDNDCSLEFRDYLSSADESKLDEHANYCLENSFENSGFVLQDVINEIGRRIGYEVEDGPYTGTKSNIGFDGLWKMSDSWIVAEVKTTDAYRINLDTLNNYSEEIKRAYPAYGTISILVIVGRNDTGDLEAQVRGSRHAWSVRLISVDALIKLMFLKNQITDKYFGTKVDRILGPFEYTKVDNIVALMFQTQQETEKVITGDEDTDTVEHPQKFDFTPSHLLREKKRSISSSFFDKEGKSFSRISDTFFQSTDETIAICCTVSKRYENKSMLYWYAVHKKWVDYLCKFPRGYYVLGCMDQNQAFCIPIEVVRSHLDSFGTTNRDGTIYWHIKLIEDDGVTKLHLQNSSDHIDISIYALELLSD